MSYTNTDREASGRAGVCAATDGPYGGSAQEQLTDALANILHYAARAGLGFEKALASARDHLATERGEAS